MKLQLLSDLHLESETFDPEPAPGAEVLILAGDIDTSWRAYERFAGWPVPVWVVAGNHEFDRRDVDGATEALRDHCARFGLTLLEKQCTLLQSADGTQRVRLLGCTRWTDFDLFGAERRPRAMRAAEHVLRRSAATRNGAPFDAAAVRAEALASGSWLQRMLNEPANGCWDRTLVVTHHAPSLRSADPRYGTQPGSASFCNADDALIPLADLWLHGHLHCRLDYPVPRSGRAPARVVCQARGLASKGEVEGHDPLALLEI
ncbi:MAG: phosphoesterase [Rubrivivax sp.]